MGYIYLNDEAVVAAAVRHVEDETGLRPAVSVVDRAILLKGSGLPGVILYLAAFSEHCAAVNEERSSQLGDLSRLYRAESRVYQDWLHNNAPELLGWKPGVTTK